MNVLFVCNQNQYRSPTAAEVFSDEFSTRSAGLYAGHLLTAQDMEWADLVVVMEEEMRTEISRRFPGQYLKKKIISLDVPDRYSYRQQELILSLESKRDLLLATSRT